jgi:predicted ArsR family transcriptional regulator
MANARQKILNYIQEQQSATVEELSKVFRVTPSNIRHHLSILVSQESLNIIGKRTALGKGRPPGIYAAVQQSTQHNLDQLADTLLSTLLAHTQPGETRHIVREVAKQMAERYPVDKRNPTRRVYSSIRALNHMNYQAHWEAHVENPRIMLGHCPYYAILDQHGEICMLDAYLMEELFDVPVRQSEKMALNSRGLPYCVFLLQNRPI